MPDTSTLFLNKKQHFCDERGQDNEGERGGNAPRIVMEFGRYPKENKDALSLPAAGGGRRPARCCYRLFRERAVGNLTDAGTRTDKRKLHSKFSVRRGKRLIVSPCRVAGRVA